MEESIDTIGLGEVKARVGTLLCERYHWGRWWVGGQGTILYSGKEMCEESGTGKHKCRESWRQKPRENWGKVGS